MNPELEKMENKITDLQKDVTLIRETMIVLSKDFEHMSMKIDAYIVGNSEKIKYLEHKVRELENKQIWLSGAAAAAGAILSILMQIYL